MTLDSDYEQIGLVEAIPARLVIHQPALLHSGPISRDAKSNPDPLRQRQTVNLLVKGR